MKVKELIEILKDLDPELDIVLQSDPEGNGYYSLAGAEETMLDEDGNALHPEDHEMAVGKAVVVYP